MDPHPNSEVAPERATTGQGFAYRMDEGPHGARFNAEPASDFWSGHLAADPIDHF